MLKECSLATIFLSREGRISMFTFDMMKRKTFRHINLKDYLKTTPSLTNHNTVSRQKGSFTMQSISVISGRYSEAPKYGVGSPQWEFVRYSDRIQNE